MTESSSGASNLEIQLLEAVSVSARHAEDGRESSAELPCLKVARRAAIDRFEVEYVRILLQKACRNVMRAAALADVSRQIIHKLIARHGL